MSTSSFPCLPGNADFRHISGQVSPLNEGRTIDEALRPNEECFLAAFTHASVGLAITTLENRYLHVSPAFCALTGYTAEELRCTDVLALTHPDDRADTQEHVQRMLTGAIPGYVIEKRYLRKDGTVLWGQISVSLLRDCHGQPTRILAFIQDITDRKRVEGEQSRLQEQLRQAQKMEAIGQMAGGVAHDFNNLLTVINGYGDLLWNNLPAGSPERDLVDEIRKAGERASALTRQLLTFSRKQVPAPVTLNFNTVLNDLKKMLHRLIGENIFLALCLEPDLGAIFADLGQMEQVIVNLVINARDAMPQGGKLTVATRNVVLDSRKSGHVLLSVSDTGCGMFPEVKARLFEPFFTTKAVGKGTGLGLALVSSIVSQNDGHIEVESEPGGGSTFRIYLPRVEAPARPSKAVPVVRAIRGGSETVLLVEDEDPVRALTRMLLEQRGYRVLEAPSGADALRFVEQHQEPIHLLLTDVVMPGMSGRALAKRLTALHPELRVLYLSGYTSDTVLRHGVQQDEAHFLAKPFSPANLARKVREVLDQRCEPCLQRHRSGLGHAPLR